VPKEGYVRFGAGRTAYVPVKVVRTPAAKGPIRLSLSNPPKGVRMKAVTVAAGESEAKCEITYANMLPGSARYNLILAGTLRAGKESITAISPAVLVLGPSAKPPGASKPTKPD
jgi:hypothetical protein